MVASDEISVRAEGRNGTHWLSRLVKAVVCAMTDKYHPAVWLSDWYTAQQSHATAHQTCLAHLAHDITTAVKTSDDSYPGGCSPDPTRCSPWSGALPG